MLWNNLRFLRWWLLFTSLLLFLLSGCSNRAIGTMRELGLSPLRIHGEVYCVDTHGGFHGDGVTQLRVDNIAFTDRQLQQAKGWQRLPLPEEVLPILSATTDDSDEHQAAWQIPKVKTGYWYFLDRQNKQTSYTAEELQSVLSRPSANYTLAVWDENYHVLYYVKFDS